MVHENWVIANDRYKGPCTRTKHCWPTTPNIAGPNNVVICCVRLRGTTTMLAFVVYSLKPVKLLGPCKRTQHCWPTTPNNVGSCWHLLDPFAWALKGYSSGQSHFSEINIKLAEKNKYATHSVQRSLEMCENKEKPSVSEDFRQKKVLPVT